VAPKEIAFLPALPRTRSGKIMRRLLKARETGLPEGDTSTLDLRESVYADRAGVPAPNASLSHDFLTSVMAQGADVQGSQRAVESSA
jgi:hypothetical protein